MPEGSYSTDPTRGEVRIRECREMIAALHAAGFGVVMAVQASARRRRCARSNRLRIAGVGRCGTRANLAADEPTPVSTTNRGRAAARFGGLRGEGTLLLVMGLAP